MEALCIVAEFPPLHGSIRTSTLAETYTFETCRILQGVSVIAIQILS